MDDDNLDSAPHPAPALLQAEQAGQGAASLTIKVPPEHTVRLARELGRLVGHLIADKLLKKAERD